MGCEILFRVYLRSNQTERVDSFMNVIISIDAWVLNVHISFEPLFTKQWVERPYYDRFMLQIYAPLTAVLTPYFASGFSVSRRKTKEFLNTIQPFGWQFFVCISLENKCEWSFMYKQTLKQYIVYRSDQSIKKWNNSSKPKMKVSREWMNFNNNTVWIQCLVSFDMYA